ncbi:WD40-repeat-containing domain protein [Kockovaella imperatae]|uniref:WD40-repeat-containing domain protein n=1 Tax=Kockovaella imperatae TaxID=4999 RepID=A0A1Y1UST9_9TREE|nr:WD40-repeat-containing domain protein [Kockovaella imperatae]ORX41080.1 WD40-repeat-containing domain protein [Kockovaella imperatae]
MPISFEPVHQASLAQTAFATANPNGGKKFEKTSPLGALFLSIPIATSMKISMISRSLDDHLPSSSSAPHPLQRNLAPHLHPFAKPREYTRALNAVKIDRMFAKPFVGALGGHQDGVYCLGKDPRRVSVVAAGGGDGEVIVHSLTLRRPLLKIPNAHRGMVGGVCWTSDARDGKRGIISCGKLDGTVKIWKSDAFAPGRRDDGSDDEEEILDLAGAVGENDYDEEDDLAMDEKARDARGKNLEPVMSYTTKTGFNSIDHHYTDSAFATGSNTVQVWDETRTAPLSTLQFGSSLESVTAVRFNKSETSVLASVGGDRSMCLYDIRTGKAERRLVMQFRSNCLSWCPTLPTVLLLGSEDHNNYTYDIRNLESPTQIYKGHVGGVMGCDWSPTGEEFVSGSYDRTIRLWSRDAGKSRDVYHTKRMQRVFDVTFTPTADYVLSASDDGNVRIWKSEASRKIGPVSTKERQSMEYRKALVDRWSSVSDIRAVKDRRHVPQSVHNATKLKREMIESRNVKEDRRRKHSRAGREKPKAERKKAVIVEQK